MKRTMIRYAAYRNMFLSFVCLTSIIIAVVCFALFLLFSRSSAREVGSMQESMLSQTTYAADIVKDQVLDLGNQLINNNALMSAMYNREVDRIQEYHAVRMLADIQSMYPFLEFIGLYNGYTDRYLNNKGVSYEDDRELLDEWRTSERKRYIRFFPRRIDDLVRGGERDVITFVLSPGYSSYLPKKGAIVVNVDAQYLNNLIGELKTHSSEFLIVMDGDGTVISHTNPGHFMENVAQTDYARRILGADRSSDNFVMDVNGARSLVTFAKSEDLNWYFVSANRYDEVLSNIVRLKRATLAIALGMLGVAFALSVWLTNQMYNPIRSLLTKVKANAYSGSERKRIDEFLMLGETFSSIADRVSAIEPAVSVARRSNLLRLIRGSHVDLANRFAETFIGPFALAIVIRIDSYRTFARTHSPKTQELIRFAICNIAQELVERQGKADTFVVEADEIGVLVQLQSAAYSPDLLVALADAQSNVAKLFGLTVTVGIGTVVAGADRIRESYEAAQASARNRFFRGPGQLFEAAGEPDDAHTEPVAYPVKLETRIVEALRLHHRQSLAAELARFADTVGKATYHEAMFYLNRLLMALHQSFETGREGAKPFMELAFGLSQCETLGEATERLRDLIMAACDEEDAKAKNKSREAIERIKAYVAARYAEPNLSLELMADLVQWTPGYLGKVFKSQCGMAFNDYLKHVRLEKAKELLLHTDHSTNAISEQIGIYNTTYFYTVFKKKYGKSPAQFRSEMTKD